MIDRKLSEKITLNVGGRGGLYARHAKQETRFNDGEVPVLKNITQSDWGIASLMQGGISLRYMVKNNIDLSVGYEVTYINGVSLAPDNFAISFI